MSSQNSKAIVLQDVSELLARIPSEDTSTCLKIGSALKNEFGDRGFDLFLQFCSKADNFEANWVKATWRSVKAHRASLGLIFHLARDLGNVLPRSLARPVKAPPVSNVLDLDDARRIRFAQQIWMACKTDDQVVAGHPYATAKEITWAAGAGRGLVSGSRIGQQEDCLVLPIRNIKTNRVQAVEVINSKGVKQTFGCKSGGALILGNTMLKHEVWAVTEGWASAVACIAWHGFQVAVCSFGKHSMESVANQVADVYRPLEIRLALENDK